MLRSELQEQDGNVSGDAVDVLIVGAGFAGLYMLYRARELGLSALVLEAAEDVGGTWFWNRYPGARCDVESLQYSYSFSDELRREWVWTERFASQPEILRYLSHVADRFELRRDIRFNTRATAAHFQEAEARWRVLDDGGRVTTTRYLILATGNLSKTQLPDVRGLESFAGEILHTGRWPETGVDFAGKHVGVMGTGSSGVQCIPVIAGKADSLTVFQRSATYSVPARNGPISEETRSRWQREYAELRQRMRTGRSGILHDFNPQSALEVDEETREREFEKRWSFGGAGFLYSFSDLLTDRGANETAADFVRRKIHTTVRDKKVAAKLTPSGFPLGTKRICVDTNYYDTFNQPNVTLVDLRGEPIEMVTRSGIQTKSAFYPVDILVLATGYDAITGAILAIDIRGRNGKSLTDTWHGGPSNYLGLMVAGFPNLFTITGPGSPSVLGNVVVSIEQHVEWIAQCFAFLDEQDLDSIEASATAEARWVEHVNDCADQTLYPLANSWYVGANVPGKPRIFMPYLGGVGTYREICREVVRNGYEGFLLGRAEVRRQRAGETQGASKKGETL